MALAGLLGGLGWPEREDPALCSGSALYIENSGKDLASGCDSSSFSAFFPGAIEAGVGGSPGLPWGALGKL